MPNLPDASKTHAKNVLTTAENSVLWIEDFEKELLSFFELDAGGGGGNSSGSAKAKLIFLIVALILVAINNAL